MKPFKFRAQAALDLRRREHDEALSRRAVAEAALLAADREIVEAGKVIDAADQQRAALMKGTVVEYSRLQWHQAWRARCLAERAQLQARRAERDQDLQQATLYVSQTHRRLRSLERLREHAVTAWMRAVQQDEQKTMDALAASRFVQEEMR